MGNPAIEVVVEPNAVRLPEINKVYWWHPSFWEIERNNSRRVQATRNVPNISVFLHRATVAWRLTPAGVVEYSVSFCAPEDSFNRKRGRTIASGRLLSGKGLSFTPQTELSHHEVRLVILDDLRAREFSAESDFEVPRTFNRWVTESDYPDGVHAPVGDIIQSFLLNRPTRAAYNVYDAGFADLLETEVEGFGVLSRS